MNDPDALSTGVEQLEAVQAAVEELKGGGYSNIDTFLASTFPFKFVS